MIGLSNEFVLQVWQLSKGYEQIFKTSFVLSGFDPLSASTMPAAYTFAANDEAIAACSDREIKVFPFSLRGLTKMAKKLDAADWDEPTLSNYLGAFKPSADLYDLPEKRPIK